MHNFFHLDFWGIIKLSALQVDHFCLYQEMQHPFIPNTLPRPHQYRYPEWFFTLRSDECVFISSVLTKTLYFALWKIVFSDDDEDNT